MEKLTKWEKMYAKRLGVTANDLHFIRRTAWGDCYGLYNNYYLVEKVFYGYTKQEIYRALLRDLFDKIGIVNVA